MVPMKVGRERSVGVRILWLFLVSPLVCASVGVVVGAITLAVQSVVDHPGRATSGVISQMLLYGGVAGLLFGLAGGLIGALVVSVLGAGKLGGADRLRWVKAGLSIGAAVGLGCAIFVVSTPGASDVAGSVVFAIGCTVACVVSGLALAFLGWREFGSTT